MGRSTYWGPALEDSQYAVFHFDVKTMSLRDADGNYVSSNNDAPLVFDSRAAAEAYCRAKIAVNLAMGCRIYDHQGHAVQSFSNEAVYDRHHGVPAGKRSLWIGIACLLGWNWGRLTGCLDGMAARLRSYSRRAILVGRHREGRRRHCRIESGAPITE